MEEVITLSSWLPLVDVVVFDVFDDVVEYDVIMVVCYDYYDGYEH